MQDVVIVGGGMVGASLAVLLGEAKLNVTLLEARSFNVDWQANSIDARVSAITAASRALLASMDVWPGIIARRASAYTGMRVWDSEGSGEVVFSAADVGVAELGHIVENSAILAALYARLEALDHVQCIDNATIEALEPLATGRCVTLSDGRRFEANVVVAADGARSTLRQLAGIEVSSHDTGHCAIVTTVRHEHSHGRTAQQRFQPTGPLAFLPLVIDGDSRYSSIVWSADVAEAERLMALDDAEFSSRLASAFEHCLGAITSVEPRHSFALTQRHAQRYVEEGFALIGDAAHSIHPLAGQGVNLGLMDAAVLAEELAWAKQRGAPLHDLRILSRYSRRRRLDNTMMLTLMDAFRVGFASDIPLVRLARNLGMRGVNGTMPIKRFLARQALGERSDLPARIKAHL
ncbi:UbiH/UbiF/VisC/COQ6 family ubiquinone biosynthesis hydroxylase [Phytohalomonas tamaricis]|uniref:UbiH/UbiF/VisC/COQ6 family ubiquinone biosynthesis hydroxylase n=1 Tax=Phytohalomonas tamaricis TaxID=2081032 RepID=UPI000D0B06BC|nr:UbiH/UbiF/VisC/COQ6 family ubiquinone biosynthesis hydroxylase [Phytohalomonas tamaricis]